MVRPTEMKWKELQEFISRLSKSESFKIKKLYYDIVKNPVKITCETISKIHDQGWRISFSKFLQGACIDRNKKILLGDSLRGYERDETLFHELVHLHYLGKLDEGFSKTYEADARNAIVEYFARPLRANSNLLRHTIETFKLEPQIYDLPSFLAFSEFTQESLKRQLTFNFDSYYTDLIKGLITTIIDVL